MEKRFDRIDAKLDAIDSRVTAIVVEQEKRLAHLETTQKGLIALSLAILTAALTSLAKALHLVT